MEIKDNMISYHNFTNEVEENFIQQFSFTLFPVSPISQTICKKSKRCIQDQSNVQKTNILPSISPKAYISSNLLTSRKMASGSPEDKDGTCGHSSTKTDTWLSLPPTWELLLKFWGPAWIISEDKSFGTLACWESTSCSLAIVLAFKWRTSLWRYNRTGPSLSNSSAEHRRPNLSEENQNISKALKAMQHNHEATRHSNRNSTAQHNVGARIVVFLRKNHALLIENEPAVR